MAQRKQDGFLCTTSVFAGASLLMMAIQNFKTDPLLIILHRPFSNCDMVENVRDCAK
jgi:hypothetical protein